jgi:hypothetical protein
MRSFIASALVLIPATAAAEDTPLKISVGGYLETYYQGHFQDPSNRITNLRGFDNRSLTFTLSNVVLDLRGEKGPIAARVMFQVGSTPSTYYLAEPVHLGTPSVNPSSGELWKYLQQANVAAKLPSEFVLEAGLFPSPIGIEVFPVKDNMNWSRSNLFFGLPFYHTGARISHAVADDWTGTFAIYNGWNSVVDNNKYPSVSLSAAYTSDRTVAQILYFGGVEWPSGSPQGQPWRNLLDAYAQYAITETVTIAGQADGGFEVNDFGTDWWVTAAIYGKLAITDELYAAIRADYFYEHVPDGASAIFWPTPWVAEATATIAYQPVDQISVRLEYRHDQADTDVYFGGDVAIDPMTLAYIPNRNMQDTVTLGVTAWF